MPLPKKIHFCGYKKTKKTKLFCKNKCDQKCTSLSCGLYLCLKCWKKFCLYNDWNPRITKCLNARCSVVGINTFDMHKYDLSNMRYLSCIKDIDEIFDIKLQHETLKIIRQLNHGENFSTTIKYYSQILNSDI